MHLRGHISSGEYSTWHILCHLSAWRWRSYVFINVYGISLFLMTLSTQMPVLFLAFLLAKASLDGRLSPNQSCSPSSSFGSYYRCFCPSVDNGKKAEWRPSLSCDQMIIESEGLVAAIDLTPLSPRLP